MAEELLKPGMGSCLPVPLPILPREDKGGIDTLEATEPLLEREATPVNTGLS